MKKLTIVCFALFLTMITWACASGAEQVLYENLCEVSLDGVSLVDGSIDETSFYQVLQVTDLLGLPEDSMDLLVWSLDVRFDEEGSGFTLMGADEKMGTALKAIVRSGKYRLAAQAGATVFTPYADLGADQWYHVELLGVLSAPNSFMYLLVWKYNGNGDLSDLQIFPNVNRRNLTANNYNGASYIRVEPNTSIDNVRIFKPGFDKLILEAQTGLVVAGESIKFNARGFLHGIELDVAGAVTYMVYDHNNNELLNNPDITIDDQGLLQVGQSVPEQDIYIRVATLDGKVFDAMKIMIKPGNIFQILSMGIDEDYTRLVDFEVVKNFYYNGSAVCVIELFDENNDLRDTYTCNIASASLNVKEISLIPVNYLLPVEFNKETWQIKVLIVSSVE